MKEYYIEITEAKTGAKANIRQLLTDAQVEKLETAYLIGKKDKRGLIVTNFYEIK